MPNFWKLGFLWYGFCRKPFVVWEYFCEKFVHTDPVCTNTWHFTNLFRFQSRTNLRFRPLRTIQPQHTTKLNAETKLTTTMIFWWLMPELTETYQQRARNLHQQIKGTTNINNWTDLSSSTNSISSRKFQPKKQYGHDVYKMFQCRHDDHVWKRFIHWVLHVLLAWITTHAMLGHSMLRYAMLNRHHTCVSIVRKTSIMIPHGLHLKQSGCPSCIQLLFDASLRAAGEGFNHTCYLLRHLHCLQST